VAGMPRGRNIGFLSFGIIVSQLWKRCDWDLHHALISPPPQGARPAGVGLSLAMTSFGVPFAQADPTTLSGKADGSRRLTMYFAGILLLGLERAGL
jgi:hypothetical protein